jgi:penicillin-binding protein 2
MPSPKGEEDRSGRRINILFVLFILIFLIYSIRLFSITILNGDVFSDDAAGNIRRTAVIPFPRGEIYDRNFDQPLAYNTDSFTVRVTPSDVASENDDAEQRKTKMLELFDRLSIILGMSREQIERKIPPGNYKL